MSILKVNLPSEERLLIEVSKNFTYLMFNNNCVLLNNEDVQAIAHALKEAANEAG